jgi:alpha-D-ribose 1-methylphosphonate 5-triphosphate synthase subunit PhnH
VKVHVVIQAAFLPHPDLRLFDGVLESSSTFEALREALSRPGVQQHLKDLPNKSLSCSAKEVLS